MTAPILELDGVTKTFGKVQAVRGVDLAVARGETVGVVGESGCGKSTLARIMVGLSQPTNGTVRFDGRDVAAMTRQERHEMRRRAQFVFQDPLSSLNPRKTVRAILEAPLKGLLRLDATQRRARVAELMEIVRLRPEFLDRYPHEFSGGQAQRIGIARALAAKPDLLVLDEPVSALDVSVQAQVLNLLRDLQGALGLTYVFISHDLAVVESLCDRVAVMYLGSMVEAAPRADLFAAPAHPYTEALLASVPTPGRKARDRTLLDGELPNPAAPPPGCAFQPRCPRAVDACARSAPPLDACGAERMAACWRLDETAAA